MENDFLKNISSVIGGDKADKKEIDTKILKIKKNAIYYSIGDNRETALQISNIAQINVGPAPKNAISKYAIASLIVGLLFLMSFNAPSILLGLIVIGVGAFSIYKTIKSNNSAGDNLIIYLNNGRFFIFNFEDKHFLTLVFETLIECINNKVSEEMIINISNSTIKSSSIGANNSVSH